MIPLVFGDEEVEGTNCCNYGTIEAGLLRLL